MRLVRRGNDPDVERPVGTSRSRIDGVGGVHDLAQLGGELKEQYELGPEVSHEPIMARYFSRQSSAKSANTASAEAMVGAV